MMDARKNGVLITGGAGFIGKALITEMVERQIPLVSFDISDKPDSLPELSEYFNWYKFSYLESSQRIKELHEIVSRHNIKTVIHLATTMFPHESKKISIKIVWKMFMRMSVFSKTYMKMVVRKLYLHHRVALFTENPIHHFLKMMHFYQRSVMA